jgi:hypothetical protein
MVKVGDVVLYTALGRTLNALVLKVTAVASHEGADGEPTLSLAFIDQEREAGAKANRVGPLQEKPGYFPTVYTEHDVVHLSHEFSDDYKRVKGLQTPAQIAAERGVGHWEELPDYEMAMVGQEKELDRRAATILSQTEKIGRLEAEIDQYLRTINTNGGTDVSA